MGVGSSGWFGSFAGRMPTQRTGRRKGERRNHDRYKGQEMVSRAQCRRHLYSEIGERRRKRKHSVGRTPAVRHCGANNDNLSTAKNTMENQPTQSGGTVPAVVSDALFGFHGSCAPGMPGRSTSWRTFSVGICPIIPKASGKGTKRGAVVVRVSGPTDAKGVAAVEAKAREIIAALSAGTYAGPKRVTI